MTCVYYICIPKSHVNDKKSFPEWHDNTMSFFIADYFFREITCI